MLESWYILWDTSSYADQSWYKLMQVDNAPKQYDEEFELQGSCRQGTE